MFLLHLALPWRSVRNGLLVVASLVFYAWGNIYYVLLMVLSAFINYLFALGIEKKNREKEKAGKGLIAVALIFNVGLLAVFKYAAFAVTTVNDVFGANISVPRMSSPIGISFFTFQAMSYLIDTYRGSIKPTRNYGRFLLYISFFAQLVQGPIIRYSSIEKELCERKPTAEGMADGIRNFVIGLAMKLIIANTMGRVTAHIYGLESSSLNAAYAWAGAFSFLLQIYFDFAGYSRMAVGLGKAFGFTIPENFDHPYISHSITEFWRRWHITLSAWFRDYVYIPMGGNRKGSFRTGVNKIIVFLLTGLWHGANWTYVVWGAYNGAFLLGENYAKKSRFRLPKAVTWLYTIIAVMVGFVIFNSPDMAYAWAMVKNMFTGFGIGADTIADLSAVFKPKIIAISVIGIVSATPAAKMLCARLDKKPMLQAAVRYGAAAVLLIVCLFYIASGNYNPSIYSQF